MRNLLSQEDKKKLRGEYKLRIVVIMTVFLFFTILAGGAELLPSYFISQSKERAAKEHIGIIKESISRRGKDISSALLLETKEKLKLIAPNKENIFLSTLFEGVLNSKPKGVNINGIFYDKKTVGKKTEILITGDAINRESLLEFKKLLTRESRFTNVELPVSNLAPDRNIKFSIRVTGDF